MKQGAKFTKFIFLMLLLALIVYGVSAAVSSMKKSITTVTAIAYEVGDGFQATGFVVRDEQVLPVGTGISVLLRQEGERVAKGEALAATYADSDAQEAQLRIDALEEELSRYEAVLDTASFDQSNAALDAQIQQELLNFAQQTHRRNLAPAQAVSNELKSLVLRRFLDEDGREAMQLQAQEIRAELASLRTRLAGAVTQTASPDAGYFSGTVDGYEQLLTPQSILTMSPEALTEISAAQPSPTANAIGRLIKSPQWYFVCVVEEAQLASCSVGSRMKVDFAYDFYETLSMTVERISEPSDHKRLLVLSCSDYMADVSSLRSQAADISWQTYTGLRVPKQAIYFDESTQQAGVFILEGAQSTWKSVKILHEVGDYYLVRQDQSDTNNLWPGDEIIITTEKLADGKVVR